MLKPFSFHFFMKKMKRDGDYVRSGYEKEFRMITDVERYGEYPDFLYLVIALSAITIGSFLWKAIFF